MAGEWVASTQFTAVNVQRVRTFRHNFTNENTDKFRKFTLTAKLNSVSKNLSFLRWVCVPNEVTDMQKLSFDGVKFGLPGHAIDRFQF